MESHVETHMDWDKDKSILITQIATALFGLLLVVLDFTAYSITEWMLAHRLHHEYQAGLMLLAIYADSVFAWAFLYQLWMLLANIKEGKVFIDDNVRRLRIVALCCALASLVSILSAIFYLPFILIGFSLGLVALAVRVVKNGFEQAIAMKSELDLTV